MSHSSSVINQIKLILIGLLIVAFPLFFLPTTQEFFITNKLYLLSFGALILILLSAIILVLDKKISWVKKSLDNIVLLFLVSIGLSTLLSSPNKIEALISPNLGLVIIFSLTMFYFYLSRINKTSIEKYFIDLLKFSALVVALVSIIFFFQPFKNVNLPYALQFLKNPMFNTIGSVLDLSLFLGFFIVVEITTLTKINLRKISESKQKLVFPIVLLGISIIALLLNLYTIFKPSQAVSSVSTTLLLPPFRLSWYAFIETLKSAMTAVFGVGVDNYASIFTNVKDIVYNQSSLWQIQAFSLSRSAFLHIATETGLLGIVSFGLLAVMTFKEITKNNLSRVGLNKYSYLYIVLVLALFPLSFPVLFLFYFMAGVTAESSDKAAEEKSSYDLSSLVPVYLAIVIIMAAFSIGSFYFLAKSYLAEYYFKKSIDAVAANNLQGLYDNQRLAAEQNPYIERFRINFSQTNLLVANNIAARASSQNTNQQTGQPVQLSDQERNTIAQAIQNAIGEAKAAVALNSQKSSNWENLANIYRNILNVAQGADAWTVSSYQRAIVLDPQNPNYRLNLGGVYYALGSFDQALSMFQSAVSLKPDWANARYNLAWASFQKKDYQNAAVEMQNVLSLLNPQQDKSDFDKAQKELEEFKKLLPQNTQQPSTESGQTGKETLGIPTPPEQSISPKIELPKSASPEAK